MTKRRIETPDENKIRSIIIRIRVREDREVIVPLKNALFVLSKNENTNEIRKDASQSGIDIG